MYLTSPPRCKSGFIKRKGAQELVSLKAYTEIGELAHENQSVNVKR
jgi:hypothetical protein